MNQNQRNCIICNEGKKNIFLNLNLNKINIQNENGQFAILPGGRCAIEILDFKKAEEVRLSSSQNNILEIFCC